MTLGKDQNDAIALMNDILKSWGLSSLAPDVKKLVVAGDTAPDTLSLALSQTTAYKARFSANAARAAAGLPELKPAEYIALEEQYGNIMRAAGMPKGFYDSHKDFSDFIANDKSPAEVADAVQIAHDQYMNAPQAYKDMWAQYGFTKGDAIAGILDPKVGDQVLKDRAAQVGIGGAAKTQGFAVSQMRAQELAQHGTTLAQAQQAYKQIGETFGTDQSIAKRFGSSFSQADEENDLLLDNSAANAKRKTLYNSEQALFGGSTGTTQNTLGVDQAY